MEANIKIGEKIRAARKEKGLTIKQLAEAVGVSEQAISQYEIGKRQPRIEQLTKIANALGVGTNAFLDTANFTFSFETVADLVGILIKLCKSNIISIEGDRDEKGFLNPNTASIHFKNSTIFSNLFKINLDKQEVTLDMLTIQITNTLVMQDFINWEMTHHNYTEMVTKYGDSPDEATKAAIAYMADIKEMIEIECQRSMVMLDTSDGHLKVKINPDYNRYH